MQIGYVNIHRPYSYAGHRGFKFGSGGVTRTHGGWYSGSQGSVGLSRQSGSRMGDQIERYTAGIQSSSLPLFGQAKKELPDNAVGRYLMKLIRDIRYTIKPLPGAPETRIKKIMDWIAG